MAEPGGTPVLSLRPGLGPPPLSAHLRPRGVSGPLALPECFQNPDWSSVFPVAFRINSQHLSPRQGLGGLTCPLPWSHLSPLSPPRFFSYEPRSWTGQAGTLLHLLLPLPESSLALLTLPVYSLPVLQAHRLCCLLQEASLICLLTGRLTGLGWLVLTPSSAPLLDSCPHPAPTPRCSF